ncbi:hypothetical protein Tco_0349410 [Tanacetum coccineum]
MLEPTSNKLMVDPHGFEDSYKDGHGERLSRSDEVLKLKNFKKDASLKLSSYQIKKGNEYLRKGQKRSQNDKTEHGNGKVVKS